MRSWIHALAFLLGSFGAAASAGAGKPLVALVQRSMPSGLEELSLTLFDQEVRLVANSNFLEPPSPIARLGIFVAPMTEQLRTEQAVLASDLGRLVNQKAAAREIGVTPASRPASPHETRWLLNGIPVPPQSLYHPNLSSLLGRARRLGDWKPQDAVEATLSSDGARLELKFTGKSPRAAESKAVDKACERRTGPEKVLIGYLCRIKGYGTAYLQPSAPAKGR